MSNVITISRQFGSGGRELGKRLADALGYAYYDKEILENVADETQTSEWYAQKVLDRGIVPGSSLHFGHSFAYYSPVNQETVKVLLAERNVLKSLAEKGDCVIVGRGANAVLEDYHPFNIFVYARMEARMQRCRRRAPEDENLSDKELAKKIRQVDGLRARSLELVSDYKWGDRDGYDLLINTSDLSIPEMIPHISEYAKQWLNRKDRSS